MTDRPTPAPAIWPYPGHRTIEQVDADAKALGDEGSRIMAERFRALRKAEAERVGDLHARALARNVVPPTVRLR